MNTPRTDEIMAALSEITDREQLLACFRVALAMMEYDLEKARARAEELHGANEFNRRVVKVLENYLDRSGSK